MARSVLQSELLSYLASLGPVQDDDGRVPPLAALSEQLGVSVSKLREQLEVARALGLVEVRPRTGIRRLPYDFFPAVRKSLAFAVTLDRRYFDQFSDLRKHVEAAYFRPAVALLQPEDHRRLQDLVRRAWEKLHGNPISIPHEEHRELHLTIYCRLDNPFVSGLLRAYWDLYEMVGLNTYTGYEYLCQVWDYHERIVAGILAGEVEQAHQALIEHTDLLYHRPSPTTADATQNNPGLAGQ